MEPGKFNKILWLSIDMKGIYIYLASNSIDDMRWTRILKRHYDVE